MELNEPLSSPFPFGGPASQRAGRQPVPACRCLARPHCCHHTPTPAPSAAICTCLGCTAFLGRLNLRYCLHVQDQEHRNCRDSPGGPLRLCVSKAVGVNLTLSQGTKIPHTTWPRKETTMTKKEDSHWKFKVRY